MKVVISDASCLIVLTKAGQLDLLRQLFAQIVTTPTVAAEYGRPLPDWCRIEAPTDQQALAQLTQKVDAGEASAIALAQERPECLLILDDAAGRAEALARGLTVVGTLGLLLRAKQASLIPAVRPVADQFVAAGLWASEALLHRVLTAAGEFDD